jgi:FAD/FMN-containing dehydrogenase
MLEIEKYGQTATGDRDGDVGVGGLTLGGGLSFHSAKRGTAADAMVNIEVVLANGSVANVNSDENADLFKALKGGGNNFGLDTRFDMRTFSALADVIWGGLVFTDFSQRDLVLNQFVRAIDINEQNPYDSASPGPMAMAVAMVNV